MIPSWSHFWNALQEKRYKARRTLFGYPFIRNANRAIERAGQKRALFVFLSEPFIMKPSSPRFHNHQNLKQSLHIAHALGDAGFVVDVVDVNSNRPLPSEQYDLLLNHRSDLVADNLLREGGKKVYLATGMNHEIYNRNLLARYSRLNTRRKCNMLPKNLNEDRMSFVREADAVAGFGNAYTAGSWSSVTHAPVMPFNNYGTFEDGFVVRDWNSANRNFLFYAGRLQIVRGLDLLLEIFPRHPELHLYICSGFKHEEDFCRCYRKELFETSNIHPVGLVSKRERRFFEIVQRCGFVILPSCSDCQPGSVIEGMHAGLIPLVTRETGLDVEEAGVVLKGDSEKEIEEAILNIAAQDKSWLVEGSRKSHELAAEKYSEAVFVARWRNIAQELAASFNEKR
jgi:glycosyltransferase involved in cell wall biosynthesis